MYSLFPLSALELLRCFNDQGRLVPTEPVSAGIEHGAVRCTVCDRSYPVSDGILSFLDESGLDAEEANERRVRDETTEEADAYIARLGDVNSAEVLPTLAALGPLSGAIVLELGCGTGRYTLPISRLCRAVVAVDFSVRSLAALASKLPDVAPMVALVHASITRFSTVTGAFDRVLSTLVSNLPTNAHRLAMYRLANAALRRDGRFVFSTHHYGIREWLKREPIEGHYRGYPVYRRLFRPREIQEEATPHFAQVECRPIQIVPPLARRLPFSILPFSRFAERVPVLNQMASILLFTAERPVVARTASALERAR